MNLVSPRLKMIKYSSSDLDYFCEIICNDEVMYHISGKGNSRKVAAEKFEGILKTNKENDYYGVYKVVLKETEKVIGFAKIVSYEKDCLEIGYALLVPYWRKGYTLEMIKKMTSHCSEYFPDKKIMAIVNKGNIGSLKVLERCNYKEYHQKEFNGDQCVFLKYTRK